MAKTETPRRLVDDIAKLLDDCRLSHAVHPRKLKDLSTLRSKNPSNFFADFAKAITPLFDFSRRTVSSERIVRFVAAFSARRDDRDAAACDAFLEEFLRFLLVAAAASHRTARLRASQIVSEIIMRLPDDAEVSDEVWDEVIDRMKERVGDKVPAIRAFAVRALSRFANDVDDNNILNIFLENLPQEQNTDVRRAIVLSMPPSKLTSDSIVQATLDVSESVRKAAFSVLTNKFPLQSLSIKLRTIVLKRGLSDRSSSVRKECLKMLKEEWLTKCSDGDPIVLLRFLDAETYESVGEMVMETLLKDGIVRAKDGQSLRQYLTSSNKTEGEMNSDVQFIEAEAALFWKALCQHLQSEAQAKGTDAATTTGTEAAVYASEASDNNDLLEGILPATLSDYVDLVKLHLVAGPSYRFTSRQLLLLGAMLDFSDTTNRKVASNFIHELLHRPLEFEVDENGNKILIGDGINLGGERDWAKAVSELAKKVYASPGEFETEIASVIVELAQPCRERTADYLQWMHCLAVTGLLLENIQSLRYLHGKAIEPSELLHSLLLPGAKQSHIDIQRVATRCLCLFGLLERKLTGELVKQLEMSFVNGSSSVKIMAAKSLIDLLTYHGPEEIDRAIGIEVEQYTNKEEFAAVDLSNVPDDLSIEVLDLLYAGLSREDLESISDSDDHESVHSVIGEGFAKILLLSDKYSSVSSRLHPFIFSRLIDLYFSNETKELHRLKQCLSVFFEHYPALSKNHKKCISKAFVPIMQSMWPGIHGNPGGSPHVVSRMRKRAIQVSQFMLQMMQTPLFSKEDKEDDSTEASTVSQSTTLQSTFDFDSGEEGLAIRIAAEVTSCLEKNTPAGRSYISALSKVAVLLQFRSSEQDAIKCMRGLLNGMVVAASADKDVVKELTQMSAHLRSLDMQPDELSENQCAAIFKTLGLEENVKLDMSTSVPPTPAPPRSVKAAPARRRVRREVSSSEDEDEVVSVPQVPITPSIASMRSQRASKTAAMKLIANSSVKLPLNEDELSEVTSDEAADDSTDESDEGSP